MTIYERCLQLAAEARAVKLHNDSRARRERLERFFAKDLDGRWRKRGKRVTFA